MGSVFVLIYCTEACISFARYWWVSFFFPGGNQGEWTGTQILGQDSETRTGSKIKGTGLWIETIP